MYQLCPKCLGQGVVSRPPGVPVGQETWTSSSTTHTCDVCNGQKILWYPPSEQEDSADINWPKDGEFCPDCGWEVNHDVSCKHYR